MPLVGSCPRCAVALERVGVPVGTALGCMRCAGLFFDDAAFGHVRESMYAELAKSAPSVRRPAPPASVASRSLACPCCAAIMTRSHVGEVEIDLCTSHGIWFDRDELQTVAQIISASRATTSISSSRQLSQSERETLARSVSEGGVGTLALGFIEEFCEVLALVQVAPRTDDD